MSLEDKLHEECGIFGISNITEASSLVSLGLHALQHRGQEGCGILSFDNNKYYSDKSFGLVSENFNMFKNLKGKYAIGHNRYSTTGENNIKNIQPFFTDNIGISHNGNISNSLYLKNKLIQEGYIFNSTSDTEVILQLITKSKKLEIIDKIIDAILQIEGGYSLAILSEILLIGIRDPFGIRPLVIGKLNDSYILSSETCALDIINAKFVREVENGEIVIIENEKIYSIKPFNYQKARPCAFEYIYFSRPDSILGNKTAYEHRKRLGEELAKENKDDINLDIVVPVPESGVASALGFSQYLNINFDYGLIRNYYIGRTFIEPTQQTRSLNVKLKLNANKNIIKDKKIVLIDDSLVRGTTCHRIIKMLYDAGAKEVHVRISCPEIKYPDFYGIDTPTEKELLASCKNNNEMCKYIGAKSLKFLSINGLYKAIFSENRNNNCPQLSDHYFTGDYPIKPVDYIRSNKINELSYLQ